MRIASIGSDDITDSSYIVPMSIFECLGIRFLKKKTENSKSYSRCKMDPLPNEIYQDIVDFQSDVNRPIELSLYRELTKEVA